MWWTRTGSSQGVDNWNGVADPRRGRLVKLQLCRLTLVGRNIWVGGGGEGEGRVGDLELAGLRTRFGRPTCQGRTVRGGRVDGHVVVFGEKVWTELQIIVEVKRALSFEACAEGCECSSFLFLSHAAELFVRILRHPRRPTTSTAMVRGSRGSIR